jgi:putative transposase
MPNHWHLVLRPKSNRDLAAYIGWVSNTHVRRYHEHYKSRGGGHVYQGRYKSFPVQEDGHLLTVLRYVEANAGRAKLAERAEGWAWSSAAMRGVEGLLDSWPVDRPVDWLECLNEPMPQKQVEMARTSVVRGRPFGGEEWVRRTARRLGLEFTLRARGRPKRRGNGKKAV